MLSGTCLITPLQGSVRVFMTDLSPSTSRPSLPIYAPLSHPLPSVARAHHSKSLEASFNTSQCGIPPALLQIDRSVFLLQELRCGIEGMDDGPLSLQGIGRIWPEGSKGAFGLEGCHPVSSPLRIHLRGRVERILIISAGLLCLRLDPCTPCSASLRLSNARIMGAGAISSSWPAIHDFVGRGPR